MASIVETIAALEKAQRFRTRYPGLVLGYAVGLAALVDGSAERCAKHLEGIDPLSGYQGEEVLPGEISAIKIFYAYVDSDLTRILGYRLNVNDPLTLEKTIDALKELLRAE